MNNYNQNVKLYFKYFKIVIFYLVSEKTKYSIFSRNYSNKRVINQPLFISSIYKIKNRDEIHPGF